MRTTRRQDVVRHHPIEELAPRKRIGLFRQRRLRSLGLADRAQRIQPDSLAHTSATRQIQAEARDGEIRVAQRASREKEDLEKERSALVEMLRQPNEHRIASAPARPEPGADARTRAQWAEVAREATASGAAFQAAQQARRRATVRMAEIAAAVAVIDEAAAHVRARWRERYDQEVAIYTRARTGKADPRAEMPAYAPYLTLEEGDLLALLPPSPTTLPRTSRG